MRPSSFGLSVVLLAASASAQELLWHIASTTDSYQVTGSFGDLDGDGADDLLTVYEANRYDFSQITVLSLRIFSGRDGAILDDRPPTPPYFGMMLAVNGVGDFDLDGYPDYAVSWHSTWDTVRVQVWSPHLHRQLLQVQGPWASSFGGLVVSPGDCSGDGLPDLAIASVHPSGPDMRVYDHFGALLWRVPFIPLAKRPLALVGMRDVNGDGRGDLLLGGADYNLGYTRGMVAVMSGSDGSFLREIFDQVPGDIMGSPVSLAGDVDGDGIEDYATGNYWGSNSGRKILSIYSGATGALVRQWSVPFPAHVSFASALVAGHDVDLDGVPDVIASAPTYYNGVRREGRVQAFSTRDLQLLAHTEPLSDVNPSYYAEVLTDLGTPSGSPFPVVAFDYRTFVGPVQKRLEVWRMSVPGERVVGAGCGSQGFAPTASVRRVETPQGEHCRIVLGSAPPGAVAFCVAAGAGESTFGGSALPYALDGLGFAGCSLRVPPTLIDARTVGTVGFDRGYAGIDVPLQLGVGGFGAAVQWLVFDFGTGAYGATPRCEVRLR